ncbi:MAG: hypothetical protein MJ153_06755 [Clostridia bacterium]|nr:hypothetical protein [Clostridia bacterium]
MLKRKLISLALSTAMCMTFLSNAIVADTEPYLYVGNVAVTDDNADDVFKDGTVSYDTDTMVLTLNGATIKDGLKNCGLISNIVADNLSAIELIGENKLIGDTSICYYGILGTMNHDVVFTGNGSLDITFEDEESATGILAKNIINGDKNSSPKVSINLEHGYPIICGG